MKNKFTFIDLFAGAGGFAEGFYQEEYNALSHIEFDKYACDTLKQRMKHYNYSKDDIENGVLLKDITDDDVIELMDKSVKGNSVDVYGNIELPVIGEVYVKGLTLRETQEAIEKELYKYFKKVQYEFKEFL